MKYIALTTRGIEEIGKKEILEALPDAKIIELSYRKILFESDVDPMAVLDLRSVEDVFVYIGTIKKIGHTVGDLPILASAIANLNYTAALKAIKVIREFDHFSISSSSVGKRNFSYIDVKKELKNRLTNTLKLEYEDELHEEFDVRIFMEHTDCIVGVRLGAKPLHRRAYKQNTTEASLRSNIAYSLCSLADIKPADIVLDPMCGSGTILVEAAEFTPKNIIGGDSSEKSVEASQKNIERAGYKSVITTNCWDALNTSLEDRSCDVIICNLPFGKQITIVGNDTTGFYTKLLREFQRVLTKPGRMVILTSQTEQFIYSIGQRRGLTVSKQIEINLEGEITTIFLISSE